MDILLNNNERFGLAVWLRGIPWSGQDDKVLSSMLDVREHFLLEEYDVSIDSARDGFIRLPPELTGSEKKVYQTNEGAVGIILSNYPKASTPPSLGPDKAKLLRYLDKEMAKLRTDIKSEVKESKPVLSSVD